MIAIDLPWYIAIPVVVLFLMSAFLCVTAAFGMLRFTSVLERLHTPAIASTMGAILALIASIIYFSYSQDRPVLHELIIMLLLVITAPITGLLMMKSARRRSVKHEKK